MEATKPSCPDCGQAERVKERVPTTQAANECDVSICKLNLISKNIITSTANLSSPRALAVMLKLGITHVYSGANIGPSAPRLDVEALRRDTDHYRLVYFKDGVYVFEVKYGT